MDDDDEDDVPEGDGPWVPSKVTSRTMGHVYHTDPECGNFRSVAAYRPARDYEIEKYSECKECADVSYRNGDSDMSYHDALVEADPEDFRW